MRLLHSVEVRPKGNGGEGTGPVVVAVVLRIGED
jgi:hypothetical protein